MTVAPDSVPVSASGLPAAIAALRARGLRVSAARRVVLEALFAAERPGTADDLASGIAGFVPESDLASVYRNLETLERSASYGTCTSGTARAVTCSARWRTGATSTASAAARSTSSRRRRSRRCGRSCARELFLQRLKTSSCCARAMRRRLAAGAAVPRIVRRRLQAGA